MRATRPSSLQSLPVREQHQRGASLGMAAACCGSLAELLEAELSLGAAHILCKEVESPEVGDVEGVDVRTPDITPCISDISSSDDERAEESTPPSPLVASLWSRLDSKQRQHTLRLSGELAKASWILLQVRSECIQTIRQLRAVANVLKIERDSMQFEAIWRWRIHQMLIPQLQISARAAHLIESVGISARCCLVFGQQPSQACIAAASGSRSAPPAKTYKCPETPQALCDKAPRVVAAPVQNHGRAPVQGPTPSIGVPLLPPYIGGIYPQRCSSTEPVQSQRNGACEESSANETKKMTPPSEHFVPPSPKPKSNGSALCQKQIRYNDANWLPPCPREYDANDAARIRRAIAQGEWIGEVRGQL